MANSPTISHLYCPKERREDGGGQLCAVLCYCRPYVGLDQRGHTDIKTRFCFVSASVVTISSALVTSFSEEARCKINALLGSKALTMSVSAWCSGGGVFQAKERP